MHHCAAGLVSLVGTRRQCVRAAGEDREGVQIRGLGFAESEVQLFQFFFCISRIYRPTKLLEVVKKAFK